MKAAKKEELPFPFVFYPDGYGTFIAFATNETETPYLCSCAKPAVFSYLKFRKKSELPEYSDPLVEAPFGSHDFPTVVARISALLGADEVEFRDSICHRCNLATPSNTWCIPMYGGLFKQKYGWYIEQARLRLGVSKDWQYLDAVCPKELASAITEATSQRTIALEERSKLMVLVNGPARDDIPSNEVVFWRNVKKHEAETYRLAQKLSDSAFRQLENIFENDARSEFGVRKVGDAWLGESLLFNIVSRLMPNAKLVRHHRPDWLEGLELDIHVIDERVAFEYQGQQHFTAIKAWGGEAALARLQARDKKKRLLCQYQGVRLIEIKFSEPLSEEHIRSRLG